MDRRSGDAGAAGDEASGCGELRGRGGVSRNYHTAYYGMQRGRLRAGETLLVHGAGGGVGLATVDVGKLFGAR